MCEKSDERKSLDGPAGKSCPHLKKGGCTAEYKKIFNNFALNIINTKGIIIFKYIFEEEAVEWLELLGAASFPFLQPGICFVHRCNNLPNSGHCLKKKIFDESKPGRQALPTALTLLI